jgi:hypothetical protein
MTNPITEWTNKMNELSAHEIPAKRNLTDNHTKSGRQRLMFVLGLAPQKIGGVEKFLRYFVNALDAAGWDSVLCFDGPIADEFREYIAGP